MAMLFFNMNGIICVDHKTCALKLPFQQLIPPGQEKFIMEFEKEDVIQTYASLHSAGIVVRVPLRYTQYNRTELFEQTLTSRRYRTCHSSAEIIS